MDQVGGGEHADRFWSSHWSFPKPTRGQNSSRDAPSRRHSPPGGFLWTHLGILYLATSGDQWLTSAGDMLEELDMIFWINMDKLGSSWIIWYRCSYLKLSDSQSSQPPGPTPNGQQWIQAITVLVDTLAMHLAILPETWKGATLCHAGEPQGLLLDIVFTGKLSATALRIMKLLVNPQKYVVNWCKFPVNHQIVVFVEYCLRVHCQHAHACCLGTYTCSFHIPNITVPPKWFVCHTPIWWLPKMGGSPSHVVSIHFNILQY